MNSFRQFRRNYTNQNMNELNPTELVNVNGGNIVVTIAEWAFGKVVDAELDYVGNDIQNSSYTPGVDNRYPPILNY